MHCFANVNCEIMDVNIHTVFSTMNRRLTVYLMSVSSLVRFSAFACSCISFSSLNYSYAGIFMPLSQNGYKMHIKI